MDYTACAVPFAFLLGLLMGIGVTRWCLCEKPKKRNSWDAPEPTTNGLHVLNEVKEVISEPYSRKEARLLRDKFILVYEWLEHFPPDTTYEECCELLQTLDRPEAQGEQKL